MNIKKNESKMYYKKDDIIKAQENKKPIIIDENTRVYIECIQFNSTGSDPLNIKFCGDVISKTDTIFPSSEFKMFYSIQDFNNFVRWQRWLND